MKKALALAVVMVFCAAIGFAAHGEHGTATEATITKVDMAGKSMDVKTADGKDMTIYWNDTTKLQGTPEGGRDGPLQGVREGRQELGELGARRRNAAEDEVTISPVGS